MKIHIDLNKCEGFASCVLVAPTVFDLDDERNVAVVVDESPGEGVLSDVRAAAMACPVSAITLS